MKKAALMVCLALPLIVAAPASASVPLDGWWPFYEGTGTVAHDVSGNHNNGIISGAATWTTGYLGSALQFDGATGRVDVAPSSSLEPSSAVTVSALVKASGSPGSFKYILAKGAAGCYAASYALYSGPAGGLMFYVSQNGGANYTRSPDAGTGIWDGRWHFVVGTYDGTNVRLYVDGKQIGNGTPLSGPIGYGLSSNDLFIGHYDGCPGFDFSGTVDEPTVVNGALSASDVAIAYRAAVLAHDAATHSLTFARRSTHARHVGHRRGHHK
jgi:hypothetical protein